MEKNWYRTEEACKILGYSKWHLYRLVKDGRLSSSKPNGGRLFFRKSDIEAWLNRAEGLTNEKISELSSTYLSVR